MSTWIYLVCTDHTPPIRAEGESGQHLSDLDHLRTDIAGRESIVEMSADEFDDLHSTADYYSRNTWRFLRQHPECSVEIRDEYGDVHPIEAS